MQEVIKINDNAYLLQDAWVNTDEEFMDDMNLIESIDLKNFTANHGDTIVMYIDTIDYEEGLTTLEVFNVSNDSVGYVILRDTFLSDDRRYYTVHHITHIFRQQGLNDVTCYWYLWRTKEQIDEYYEVLQSYIDLE